MSRQPAGVRMLHGFVWTLLQALENCRLGLRDETARDAPAAEAWCAGVYARERPRLTQAVAEQEHIPADLRPRLESRVDELVSSVLLPGYTRLATAFTLRERGSASGSGAGLQGLEALAWAGGGALLGLLFLRAPFFPLWSKAWVLAFVLAGALVPQVRAWLGRRRYAAELAQLATAVDDEIARLDLDYSSPRPSSATESGRDGQADEPPNTARSRVR